MRSFLSFVGLLVLGGLLIACGNQTRSLDNPTIQTIAHRGASGLAPEHTFPAYDLALEFGADYLEQDLQLTADNVLVVLHDDTLDRTARGPTENCTGSVRVKTLAQLKTCDMGSWFNEQYPEHAQTAYVDLRLPTLEEVFQRYGKEHNGRSVRYYIETKSPSTTTNMEDRLLELMDKYALRIPARERQQVIIQSFEAVSLQKLATLDPALPLVQLFRGLTSTEIQAQLDGIQTYADGIGPASVSVDRTLVASVHARNMVIHPYTVNEEAEMRRLIDVGVDGMFTNFPKRLKDMLIPKRTPTSTPIASIGGRSMVVWRSPSHQSARR